MAFEAIEDQTLNIVGVHIMRIEQKRLFESGQGFLITIELIQGVALAVMRKGMVWVEVDRLLVQCESFLIAFQAGEGAGFTVVGKAVSAVNPDGLFIPFNGCCVSKTGLLFPVEGIQNIPFPSVS